MQASITSPTSPPYVAKQLTALFHTQPLFSFLVYCQCSTNDILRILVKAQPSTRSTGSQSPRLGLAYDRKTWAYPMSTVLATVAFLLLLDTRAVCPEPQTVLNSFKSWSCSSFTSQSSFFKRFVLLDFKSACFFASRLRC